MCGNHSRAESILWNATIHAFCKRFWWHFFTYSHFGWVVYQRAVLLRAIFCWVSWRWALPEFLKKPVLLKSYVLNFLSILPNFPSLEKQSYVKSWAILQNLNSWIFELTKAPILHFFFFFFFSDSTQSKYPVLH